MAQLQAITTHMQQAQQRQSAAPPTTPSTAPTEVPSTDRPRASEQEKEVGKLLRASIGKFSGKDRRPHTLLNFLAQFEEYVGFMSLAGREKSSVFVRGALPCRGEEGTREGVYRSYIFRL